MLPIRLISLLVWYSLHLESFAMTIKPTRFTPETLLSAPRRGAGIPNSNLSQILYTVSSYSFADHKRTAEIRVLDAKTDESKLVTSLQDASEPQWIRGDHLVLLAPGDEGTTKVVVGSVSDFDNDQYTAGIIDGPAGGVKIKQLNHNSYLFAIAASARPDGSLYNPEKAANKKHTTGRLYNKMWVRHWDQWLTSNRQSIWYGSLSKNTESGLWELSELINALKGTGLESPIPPFGGTDNYDISPSGLLFVAKDPKLQPATNTKSNVYLITREDFDGTQSLSEPHQISINGYEGASTSPAFSADGSKLAFLQMTKNGYEADRNEIFTIPDIRRPAFINHLIGFPELKKMWDISPSSVQWNADGKKLFVTGEESGYNCLWSMSADYLHLSSLPSKIYDGLGSVAGKSRRLVVQSEPTLCS